MKVHHCLLYVSERTQGESECLFLPGNVQRLILSFSVKKASSEFVFISQSTASRAYQIG